MSRSAPNGVRYRFGPFELDPAEGRLLRSGSQVKLQDLPLRLLVQLVERPGQIVTREEVRQRLWPEDTFVEFDNSLGVAVENCARRCATMLMPLATSRQCRAGATDSWLPSRFRVRTRRHI